MVLFLFTIAMPRTPGRSGGDLFSGIAHNLAVDMTNYLFILAAVMGGWVVGWVTGVVVCRA